MKMAHNGNILIVDDDKDSLSLLFKALETIKYRIFVAENGRDALRLAQKYIPDTIMLDVKLPDLNGFEVCSRLKSIPETKQIPVIFMTGLTETVDKLQGFQSGGVDYITKPFDYDELVMRLKTHLNLQHLQKEIRRERDRFRRLVEASSEGVLILKGKTIQEANPAAEKITGYPFSELMGMNCGDLFTVDNQYIINELIENDIESHVLHDVIGHRKDGKSSLLKVHIKRVQHFEKKKGHIALLQDQTHKKRLEDENRALRQSINNPGYFGDMVGISSAMKMAYKQIALAAKTDETVMISGETGTGKELAARMIFKLSSHYARSFVTVNCASILDSLFESQFFGYCKGAFTGASEDMPGFLDQANGGTLFLDEVGELKPMMQAKLLRVFQNGDYMPVGSTKMSNADLRILAATNRNIREMMETGSMREDFFHRLNVIHVNMPPLRDRIEDIPLLVKHFLSTQKNSVPASYVISDHQMRALCSYNWPGNVRELFNVLRRFRIDGTICFDSYFDKQTEQSPSIKKYLPLGKAVSTFEKHYIKQTLEHCDGKKQLAAEMLGITRRTLYNKLK